jgi:hypothetical protein
MNSLQPELKHQPNAIKTKLINSKFQSETAVSEHITTYQVKAQTFLPRPKTVLTLTMRYEQYQHLLNTPSKSLQIYSTKIHDKIHSICMYQVKMKTARFEVLTAVLLKIQVFW